MTIRRWSWIAGWLTLLGGVAWLAKIAVIVAKDGRDLDTGPAAWLMRLGLVGLFSGATGVALWLARRSRVVTRVVAVLLSPVALACSLLVIGTLATSALGKRGPAYLEAEIGIVAAAAVWLLIGVGLLMHVRRTPQDEMRALPHAEAR